MKPEHDTPPIVAARMWPYLVAAAVDRALVSFDDLRTFVDCCDIKRAADAIRCIGGYCSTRGLPPLDAIIVDAPTDMSADSSARAAMSRNARRIDVYMFAWYSVTSPTGDELERSTDGVPR